MLFFWTGKARESSNRLVLMVLMDCSNTIVGRLSIVIYYYVNTYAPQFIAHTMPFMSSLAFLLVYLSYSLKFFLFYFFNKRFREICLLKLNRLFALSCSR